LRSRPPSRRSPRDADDRRALQAGGG
jgi:hypothetical protein